MTRHFIVSATVLVAALAVPAAAPAQDLLSAQPRNSIQTVNDSALSVAISEWNSLRQSDALPFSSYARFLVAHPGWPGEAALRKSAERALRTDAEDPNLVAAYFTRYAPTTATSGLRYAEALDASGRREDARRAAKRAWTLGALSADDEARLMARWPGLLTAADHDARMERLLANRAPSLAARQLAWTSPARQPVYAARIAMQARAVDAATQMGFVSSGAGGDPGFLIDRVSWLRGTGQEYAAQALLAAPRRLTAPPLDAEKWFETLLGTARNAAAQGQYATAYDIARQVDDAYAPGTQVRDRSLGERDEYTSLTWLAGTTALNRLNRPRDAMAMFDRYARAAKSPQTQSKGLYWAGRAAQAAGLASNAQTYYANAAVFFDQFYGQLAAERLGRPPVIPAPTTVVEISRNQRDAFFGKEIVRATQILGSRGDWPTQSLFVRQIAQAAESDVDHVLGVELSRQINRPDLGVMIGRSAGINGYRDSVRSGFPTVPVPAEAASNWTMVHAISRQESQFDRNAVSRVGARGLMQLMPGTARDTSVKIGATYNAGGLTADPQYNIRLGSWYFERLMDRYNGSYPLAVAAYNAGAGNVNKWLAANGDPRTGSVDIITWIEAIPFSETRGYVQRVLENAVVYDLIDPSKSRVRSSTPLSSYLGKRTPG
ncbi:MAG: transglycosylase SLT domain-containing protein [Sphingomonadales bacterium]